MSQPEVGQRPGMPWDAGAVRGGLKTSAKSIDAHALTLLFSHTSANIRDLKDKGPD